ncbi:signal recognition particle-docking protein FtsY, partial [Vibrio alginolyticus]|nr:signal recognition particle-docking protein FtsY [Vibrio alginolyticus]MCR9352769.1 signal recognition particle-docking protein FtsY [Vibrio alginolyticus]MCR9362012.1 signal recognition particle-docking protein FtsY [Vibrio alginolyticus]
MTEKKKRGLLSWLGFGDEEQSPKPKTEETVKEEAVEAPSEEQQTEAVAEQAEATPELEEEEKQSEAA